MAFSTGKQSPNGLDKRFGNQIPEDENSNKTGATPKRVGPISGRLKTYKTSVASLNRGEWSGSPDNATNLNDRDDQ